MSVVVKCDKTTDYRTMLVIKCEGHHPPKERPTLATDDPRIMEEFNYRGWAGRLPASWHLGRSREILCPDCR